MRAWSWIANNISSAFGFGIIQPPFGTSPTAGVQNDTLTFTSTDLTVVITGNSGAKSIDFSAKGGGIVGPGITIDGGGGVITTGSKGYLTIPYACTITGWVVLADVSGSIVIDVKRSTYAGFPTTSSIAGSELPTLTAQQNNRDLSITTWTTTIAAQDVLEFVVNSASTLTRANLVLIANKT